MYKPIKINHKLDACKITQNIFNNPTTEAEYKMEEQNKQNKTNQIQTNDNTKEFEEFIAVEEKQEEIEDFTELWNQIQVKEGAQKRIAEQKIEKTSEKREEKGQEKIQEKRQENNSQSSCELTEQEMLRWISNCQQTKKEKQQNFLIHDQNSQKEQASQNQSDHSWDSLNNFLKDAFENNIEIGETEARSLAKLNCEVENNHKDSIQLQQNFDSARQKVIFSSDSIKFEESFDESSYGPWKIHQNMYGLYKIANTQSQSLKKDVIELCQSINWEIEKQIQSSHKKSRHLLKTSLIQFGKDFLLYDVEKFCKSQLRDGIHMYLGVQSFGEFNSEKQLKNNSSCLMNYDVMLFPFNGEYVMRAQYPHWKNNNVQGIQIFLSLTNQKIAVVSRKVIPNSKERREIYEIRNFDTFEKRQTDYLGIIEIKIEKLGQQWYCETTIFTPKRKMKDKKINDKNWNKLVMELKLSDQGTIMAELGILEAKSSVTNCILFCENNRQSHLMMGAQNQSQHSINYITRMSGVSPLITFVATISRKVFVNQN